MRFLAPLLCLVAASCAGVHVTTDHDPDVDFSRLRSYAWAPRPTDERDALGFNSLVRKRVVSAVERELADKGLRRDDAAPDFLVALHASSRDRIDVTTWPGWGYGWGLRRWGGWGGDRVDVTQYVEGALVVDFVDPRSHDLMWRGVARSIVDDESGSRERVDEAVRALLEQYPPRAN